jgi:hypothetical protein
MENEIITKAKNNRLALGGLVTLATLCIGISAGILYFNPDGACELLKTTFAPVGLITAGLLGFVKH